MTLKDIRHKDPTRDGINEKTIVFDDLTDVFLDVSAELSRFELHGESRFATRCRRSIREMKRLLDLFSRRVTDEQLRVNKAIRNKEHLRSSE